MKRAPPSSARPANSESQHASCHSRGLVDSTRGCWPLWARSGAGGVSLLPAVTSNMRRSHPPRLEGKAPGKQRRGGRAVKDRGRHPRLVRPEKL